MSRDRLAYLILPVAAAIAILPLILHGPSCGHDFDFHLLNWFEAAAQFRHGNLHPQWAFSPAWNAGEPRFVFYPPLSWTMGAVLGLILPWTWTPVAYTWLALTAAGLAMHRVVRAYVSPAAALLASTLYLANPYMLFTAYERTAYAELLAATFLPLLIHAILKPSPTIIAIGLPLALLWLTNAPAAVMGTYTLALLALVRLTTALQATHMKPRVPYPELHTPHQEPRVPQPESRILDPEPRVPHLRRSHRLRWVSRTLNPAARLAFITFAGTILGLSLAAFYIVPAATERPLVQIAMVVIPGMRIDDNTLFHHTGTSEDALAHDAVLHTASLIAVTLLSITAILLLCGTRVRKTTGHGSGVAPEVAQGFSLGSQQPLPEDGALAPGVCSRIQRRDPLPSDLLLALGTLTAVIALLLTPISLPLWHHSPELAFLQFPWRLLAVLAVVLALAASLALDRLFLKMVLTALTALSVACVLTAASYHAFHQPCDVADTVPARLAAFVTNQGAEPTDEYTPAQADNDSLHQHNPPFWLALNPDDPPPGGTMPAPTPLDLIVLPKIPEYLILNLRQYPAWHITLNGAAVSSAVLTQTPRADGLLTLPVAPGQDHVQLTYRTGPLEHIAAALSAIALLFTATLSRRSPGSVLR